MKTLLVAAVGVFLFTGCGGSSSPKPKKKKNKELEETTPFKGLSGRITRLPISW